MPQVHIAQNTFTTGQLDPVLHERYEYAGYASGAALLENFLVLPQGGITKRAGSRFVTTARDATTTRLIPFVISPLLAYVLELSDNAIRVFKNGALVTGVVITTSYDVAELDAIQWAIYGSTMVLVHPSHPTSELIRVSDTNWLFRPVRFGPPPSFEQGTLFSSELTFDAISGNGLNVEADSPTFYPSDVNRTIAEEPMIGVGRAIITAYVDPSNVTVDVLVQFLSPTVPGNSWRLLASPQATLTIDQFEPVGARVIMRGQSIEGDGNELVTDGDFPDLTNWTDLSGAEVASGAATGGTDELLEDTAASFVMDGVKVGHRAINTTDTTEDSVLNVAAQSLTTNVGGAAWTIGDTYTINKTGAVTLVAANHVMLDGGVQGLAHLEQAITTVVDQTYRIQFDVADAPLSMMVGTASGLADVLAEFSYQPGLQVSATFVATATTTYIAFRNNQNVGSSLSNVSVMGLDGDVWRVGVDEGRFVKMNNGIIEITEVLDGNRAKGTIRKALDDGLAALAGAWSVEDSQWSAALGYPKAITFQGGRLHLGGTTTFPSRFWGSRISIYSDFGLGVDPSDSYQYDLAASERPTIQWMAGERALVIGTDTREFTVRGELGHTITSTSVDVSSPTAYSSANIQPARSPSALLFVPRSKRRVYENAGVDDFSGDDRDVQDRSILAENLTRLQIHHIAYQQEPRPILWVTTIPGELLALTYLREQVVAGWAAQPMQGNVIDVCVIPHPDGDRDQVWLLVNRGGTIPYIEYLDDANGAYSSLQVDSGYSTTYSTPSTTLSNLGHLEGFEVAILVDGVQQPNQTVMGGQVTLDPSGLQAEAGLPFTPTVETLRPTYQNVPLSGLHLSSARVSVNFLSTLNAVVNGERVNFGEASTPMDTKQPLYSGPKEIETVGWDLDAKVRIVQDQPYPITVLNVTRYLEIEQVGGQGGQ